MVAETKESPKETRDARDAREAAGRFADTVHESVRTAFDTTRRAQESMFKSFADGTKTNGGFPGFDAFFTTGERLTREFGPLVSRNIETFAETFQTGLRANADVFLAVFDAAVRPEENDLYKRTRKVWDTAFDAFRTQMNAFGKSTQRAVENCSEFCQTIANTEGAGRTNSRGTKQG
jgi:hypothetical protein